MPIQFMADGDKFANRRCTHRRETDAPISQEDVDAIKKHLHEFDRIKQEVSETKKLVQYNHKALISYSSELQNTRDDVNEMKEIVLLDHETLLLRTEKIESIPVIAEKVNKLCLRISLWSGAIGILAVIGTGLAGYIFSMLKTFTGT